MMKKKEEKMKKVSLLTLSILMVFAAVNLAMAAGYKPPRQACYNLTSTGGTSTVFDNGTLVMTSKNIGMKAKSVRGNMTFYDVKASIGASSVIATVNLTGSAYVDTFQNTYEGNMTGYYSLNFYGCEFYYYYNSDQWSITCTSDTGTSYGSYQATEIDCRTISIE